MKLEQSFDVEAPIERVWEALIDVEKVAPCLPGAAVTGRNDDGTYDGTFTVKIGPTSASYAGKLQMEELDESSHTATMKANGTDKRGQGSASATVFSRVSPAGENRTHVEVVTDYHITGRLARFGRGGMIEDISEKLLREFAGRLQGMLEGPKAPAAAANGGGEAPAAGQPAAGQPAAGQPAAAQPAAGQPAAAQPAAAQTSLHEAEAPTTAVTEVAPPVASEPVEGISLVVSVLWSRIRRNPIPAAFVAGLLLAFALLGRRRRG